MKIDFDFFGLKDAGNLLAHLREGEPFRIHVQERLRLVAPALAVCVLLAGAFAAATAVFFADLSSWLALPGFLLAPVVLAGSLYLLGLAFFLWVERRALALALGHAPRGGLGELPGVPPATLLLALPLLMLVSVWPLLALALAAAAALVPVLYARFDRGGRRSRLTRPRAAV